MEPVNQSTRKRRDAGVAIVGLAGRFPGASTVKDFWRNLMEGREAVHFASDAELSAAGVDSALIADPDYVRASSSIRDPEWFDASFFGFSAREAEIVDPQQRVFLECAWEALEDAAYDLATYPGAIGIFAGSGMNTYGTVHLMTNPQIVESVGPYQIMVGNDKDFLCSRVAYKLNLRGPAVGVQTACSTSLVAVQMAFESLLRGECDMALAGGVSISLPQVLGYKYVPGMILSRDGHCRAFDAAASGTVSGAGCGIAVLKRLEEAIADGDHIYAVIHGAAINNDGSAKVGYSAPSVDGQSEVIRKSLEMAGFDPESIGYIEAHGTGTEIGDPIEVAALAKVFRPRPTGAFPCFLGAVKTNIGHLDTASGIAGLIKTALCLRHRAIPPTLHFAQANPLIDFATTPFSVNAAPVVYDRPAPFRAGVSSFGIGGTNAHVSLTEPSAVHSDPVAVPQLIVLSAKTPAAMEKQAAQLANYLDENPAANLADVAFTLQKGRHAFHRRRILVAEDIAKLTAALRSPRSQSPGPQLLQTDDAPNSPAQVAFLFPGQGTQFPNMGRGLYETAPAFRDAIDRCCSILGPRLDRDLRALLYPAPGTEQEAERFLNQTANTQPALFAVEYATAALWMDCGIHPAAMLGHSIGEYVAACIAGVFSLEDALALVAVRGQLIQAMPSGAMLAVGLPEHDLAPLLTPELSIAAVNAPEQAVASGPEAAVEALESLLKSKKIECRRLRTSHAFHSAMMDDAVGEYVQRIAAVQLNAPKIRFLSNTTGDWITDAQATDPAYWGRQLRNTVRFVDCARRLLRETDCALLEAGPGSTLLSLLRQQLEPRSARSLVPSMQHDRASKHDGAAHHDRAGWLSAAGRLWLANAPLDWDGLHRGERRVRVSLPTYPFDRQRYWVEPKKPGTDAAVVDELARKLDVAYWFYVPSWKRSSVELLKESKIDDGQTWLVFAGEDSLSKAVAEGLGPRGKIVVVRPGNGFRRVSPAAYEIDATSREDYVRLIQDLMTYGRWPDRTVFGWVPTVGDKADLDRTVELGIFSAMFLVQAVAECGPSRPVEFNILCEGAYSLMGEPTSSPMSVALNAFCAVVALECQNFRCRTIDVELQSNPKLATEQILRELLSPASDETIAYRGTARWIQRYDPVRLDKSNGLAGSNRSVRLRNGGVYLITGGLGGVGLVLAQHLAQTTKARIVLTSRSAFPDASKWKALLASPETPNDLRRKLQGVQSIEDLGGEALVLDADVADLVGMRKILAHVRTIYGPIHGIIHAAGVAGAGTILTKSREQVQEVLSSKVQGTEWIRDCLAMPDLDFVFLCSSISAVVPSFGQSDYSAANAYLNGFAAAFDNPKGTRVISANWDTWREVGMAVDTPLPAGLGNLREDGLKHALFSTEAKDVFDRLLQAPMPQAVISTRDLEALTRRTRAAIATLQNSPQHLASDGIAAHARPESLDGYAPAENEIERFIVNTWQELLGIEPIGIHDDFFELGGHSLLGTQVLARLREQFKVDLSLRIVFEAATPAELARHVRLKAPASSPATPTAAEREEIEI